MEVLLFLHAETAANGKLSSFSLVKFSQPWVSACTYGTNLGRTPHTHCGGCCLPKSQSPEVCNVSGAFSRALSPLG